MAFLIEKAKELGIIPNQSITSGNVTNNMLSQSNVIIMQCLLIIHLGQAIS